MDRISFAKAKNLLSITFVNRHGLIAGATGTGKTVTLQKIAEAFSSQGIPVFITDIKGDLSGLAKPGTLKGKLQERWTELSLEEFTAHAPPVEFWDVFATNGVPFRTTISEFGPLLLSRFLGLNETQTAVVSVAFKIADKEGLPILDLKDLKALLSWIAENQKDLKEEFGALSPQSISAIARSLMTLDETFFGEPAVTIDSFLKVKNGEGVVNILDATKLHLEPQTYAMTLLWLLSELYETLPEVGDTPKMAFFFDEAHLLFNDAPKILVDRIEQVIRLIRSKGVGVYFVTQSPSDIPETVLAQLGNRIQHALRAFTPKDQKAVKVAAQTFRPNPSLDTEKVITELGIGEALVSVLDKSGAPTLVERALIIPPRSQVGPITPIERAAVLGVSTELPKYKELIDRESAHELLAKRTESRLTSSSKTIIGSMGKSVLNTVVRTISSRIGREIVRGVLGSLSKR